MLAMLEGDPLRMILIQIKVPVVEVQVVVHLEGLMLKLDIFCKFLCLMKVQVERLKTSKF